MWRRDIELPDLYRLVVMPKQCIVQAMKAISVHSIALRGEHRKRRNPKRNIKKYLWGRHGFKNQAEVV